MHVLARRSPLVASAALFTLVLASYPARAQSPGAVAGMGPLAQQEKAIWDAMQSASWDTVGTYLAPNFVFVGEQISDRAQSMEGMKTCKTNSYSLHDAQSRSLSADIVVLTYVATVDEVCGGQPIKGDFNCTSLWQRQNGKWMGVAHTEAMAARH